MVKLYNNFKMEKWGRNNSIVLRGSCLFSPHCNANEGNQFISPMFDIVYQQLSVDPAAEIDHQTRFCIASPTQLI